MSTTPRTFATKGEVELANARTDFDEALKALNLRAARMATLFPEDAKTLGIATDHILKAFGALRPVADVIR